MFVTRKKMWDFIDELQQKIVDRDKEIRELRVEIEAKDEFIRQKDDEFRSNEKLYAEIINTFKDKEKTYEDILCEKNREIPHLFSCYKHDCSLLFC